MSKNLIQDVVKVKKTVGEKSPENFEKNFEKNIDTKFDSLYKNKTAYTARNFNGTHKVKSQPTTIAEEFGEREYNNSSNSKYGLWFVALIALVFLFFAVSFLFSGAKITIEPKAIDLSLNENFAASKDSASNILPFDLVVISGDETKEVQGGEEVDAKDSATGTVVIYNTFSSATQRLDINTRLEGSNGKIYKTKNAVVVPGMTSSTPGSVEVGIYASDPGDTYNSKPLDFTIFGFKGTPKYSKFYARSTGDITGGFIGKVRRVSDVEKTNAIAELKEMLRDKLLQKATGQTPTGYVLYEDAIFVQTDEGTVGNSLENGKVPVTVKGTLYGFLFDEKKLTQRIVQNNLEKYKDEDIFIPDIKSFKFVLNNKDNINFSEVKDINFDLSGDSKIVWRIDTDKLTKEVVGRDKKDFNQVLTQYTGIDSAELVIKPVWRKTFPDKFKDIKIIVNYP